MPKSLSRGDVVLVSLPSHQPQGREQEGKRPTVIVGIPQGKLRYPVILVVPLTTQMGDWVEKNSVLYPRLEAGVGNLSQPSIVLLDQVRAIDVQRVVAYFGSLTAEQYQPILEGLRQILGI
ncbi:MAG: type II toxin-antitoxin system PemK/MazF family toxin [Leptolyngbyaceae cyanobacterium RM1_406_9]|nr:type II toxin-antitoxin system PemK/MazF family toxin [Leptolyngbyaceae cyanobacterium RM1_406_9]